MQKAALRYLNNIYDENSINWGTTNQGSRVYGIKTMVCFHRAESRKIKIKWLPNRTWTYFDNSITVLKKSVYSFPHHLVNRFSSCINNCWMGLAFLYGKCWYLQNTGFGDYFLWVKNSNMP